MIHVEELGKIHSWKSMYQYLDGCYSLKEKIDAAIEVVKHMPIDGCITGSVWLPGFDPDIWGSTPDIDVFVYSEHDLVRAIDYAMYKLEMKPGTGSDRSEKQERWKIDRLFSNGLNYKIGITTYKFYCEGIVLNFTYKMTKKHGRWIPITDAPGVLRSFDMSIVLQAYDIKSRIMYDLRPDNVPVTTAIPNPMRDHDCVMWTVSKWVRQFDRVVKYYSRGFDTRPVAEFYLKMIDECIDAGCLFDSEESHEAFNQFSEEFIAKRAIIADWLEEHKED
jgi:hypothetical protein